MPSRRIYLVHCLRPADYRTTEPSRFLPANSNEYRRSPICRSPRIGTGDRDALISLAAVDDVFSICYPEVAPNGKGRADSVVRGRRHRGINWNRLRCRVTPFIVICSIPATLGLPCRVAGCTIRRRLLSNLRAPTGYVDRPFNMPRGYSGGPFTYTIGPRFDFRRCFDVGPCLPSPRVVTE